MTNTAPMRLLVTGGAGTLGAAVVEHYLPRGLDILVLDDFSTGSRDALPTGFESLEVVEGSVADNAIVEQVTSRFGPTHIIHAAASYNNPDDWRRDASVNLGGSINVTRAAEQSGAQRIIYLQTALCYGRPDTTPIPNDAPIRPFTSYGISKTAGEQYMLMSATSAVSLRLANVTGPRLSIGPIPTFYQRLKANKACFCTEAVRDFLDMSDFLSLMDRVLDKDAPTGAFNVSTGTGHGIKEIFDTVSSYLDIPPMDVPVRPVGADDVPTVVLDPTATEHAFGWHAEVSFAPMMTRMLKWYDDHGVGTVHSHLRAPDTEAAAS